MHLDLSYLIGFVGVVVAILSFFINFKKQAKEEEAVDSDQNIKIAKLETRIDDLDKRVVENKNDMFKELGKIEEGMKEMRLVLNQILSRLTQN